MFGQKHIGIEVNTHNLFINLSFFELLESEVSINSCVQNQDIDFSEFLHHSFDQLPI